MKIMTGEAPQDHNAIPQSIIPKEKVTAWDIQKVMRAQSDQVDRSVTGWHLYDLRDIGNIDTHDSVVFKMTKDPLLTVSWRSNARPYETAFVPAFPLAGPAEAQSFMDYKTGTRAQFHCLAPCEPNTGVLEAAQSAKPHSDRQTCMSGLHGCSRTL